MTTPPHKIPINVTIVENDDPLLAHLAALVGGAPGFRCVGAHHSAEQALKSIKAEEPDVILLDLEMPGMNGQQAIPQFKAFVPQAQILVLTIHDEADWLFPALEAGAMGYLHKPLTSSAELVGAIQQVHAGGSPMSSQIARKVLRTFHAGGEARRQLEGLTGREEEVLGLLAQGAHNREIAEQLGISPLTVGTHIHRIYEKLRVHSRAEAASLKAQAGPGR